MSSPSASASSGALATVREAVALVCSVDPVGLAETTRFVEVGADSLARVSIADVIEASIAARTGRAVRIDDTALREATTLADLARYVERRSPAGAGLG